MEELPRGILVYRGLHAEGDGLTVDITTTDDGRPLVVVAGDLDVATSPSLATAIEGIFDDDTDVVVVDLNGVPFMDSSGFPALLGIHRA